MKILISTSTAPKKPVKNDRVAVKWMHNHWYLGTVQSVGRNLTILFDDGEKHAFPVTDLNVKVVTAKRKIKTALTTVQIKELLAKPTTVKPDPVKPKTPRPKPEPVKPEPRRPRPKPEPVKPEPRRPRPKPEPVKPEVPEDDFEDDQPVSKVRPNRIKPSPVKPAPRPAPSKKEEPVAEVKTKPAPKPVPVKPVHSPVKPTSGDEDEDEEDVGDYSVGDEDDLVGDEDDFDSDDQDVVESVLDHAGEVRAARSLIAAVDSGGVPLNPVKVNNIARSFGLEVSGKAKVEDTLDRIRQALKRV